MNKNPTQARLLLAEMEAGKRYTQLTALQELGIARLASRISELRGQGYPIKDRFVSFKNRFGGTVHVKEYWIE